MTKVNANGLLQDHCPANSSKDHRKSDGLERRIIDPMLLEVSRNGHCLHRTNLLGKAGYLFPQNTSVLSHRKKFVSDIIMLSVAIDSP